MFKKWKFIKRAGSVFGFIKGLEWFLSIILGSMIGWFSKLNEMLGLWLSIPLSIAGTIIILLVITYIFLIIQEKLSNKNINIDKQKAELNEKPKQDSKIIFSSFTDGDIMMMSRTKFEDGKFIFFEPKAVLSYHITKPINQLTTFLTAYLEYLPKHAKTALISFKIRRENQEEVLLQSWKNSYLNFTNVDLSVFVQNNQVSLEVDKHTQEMEIDLKYEVNKSLLGYVIKQQSFKWKFIFNTNEKIMEILDDNSKYLFIDVMIKWYKVD